jgi:hypothetical protein
MEFYIEVAGKRHRVTAAFYDVFMRYQDNGKGRKNPLSVFSEWLTTTYPDYEQSDMAILAMCMAGQIQPLSDKERREDGDEKVYYAVLKHQRSSTPPPTLEQSYAFVAAARNKNPAIDDDQKESVSTRFKRARKRIEGVGLPARTDIAIHPDTGELMLLYRVKGVTKAT